MEALNTEQTLKEFKVIAEKMKILCCKCLEVRVGVKEFIIIIHKDSIETIASMFGAKSSTTDYDAFKANDYRVLGVMKSLGFTHGQVYDITKLYVFDEELNGQFAVDELSSSAMLAKIEAHITIDNLSR